MRNVQSAMGRIATIRSSMGLRSAAPAAPVKTASSGTAPMAAQALFAQTLAQATLSQTGRSAAIGNYGQPYASLTPTAGARRTGAPPGLEGYQNGQIPLQALGRVPGTGEALWAPAASAFAHMRADAAQQGVALPIVDAYRTLEDQHRLAGELGLYSEGGLAAHPGTSQHGWGRAVDIELDDRSLNWMRNNAWKYGFVEPVPREPWHWEFHPSV